jgi:peptidylprolyl isomerase
MKTALLAIAAMVVASPVAAKPASSWKTLDPQNVLVVGTAKGPVYIELHPELAPLAVERIKLLTRRGSYDGLQFWRVVPKFVVQFDVGNAEGGKTELPNLKPEFRFRMTGAIPHTIVSRPQGLEQGLIGSVPYMAVEENTTATPKSSDGSRSAWVTYCTGVVGMGRDAERDSANAEIFFMTGAYPGLDSLFTPVGRIVSGQGLLDALPPGEPPENPAAITTVRILADIEHAPRIEVMDTQGPEFARIVARARATRGADFSVCDVAVPARIAP